ncbi:sugar ABC transporter substrate-binding protein [Metabacillus idriensis]|uniref:ABC transporter substrate-binding protein n=1 Tax=Metabacillus idriensis TaxID=324768 RepID=UPI00281403D3|nr:sugar ABC transporter substrate-binding protein [Metabacillus idriensis]MDR0136885.1 sugar ABC transporter substrate-binding protein [Metabacillus idriensis]
MNRKVRKLLLLIIATLLAISLSACSAQSSNGQDSSGKNPEKTKLRIVWWGSQERHDATLKVIELYKEKNPDVSFETEFSGWDGYWDKLATQSAAKNAPDIIQMDAQYLQEYASRNQLADLTDGIETKDIDENLLNSGVYEDQLKAIPLGNNAYGMIYNKAALEKLGIEAPKTGWTWDEFFELAEQIQPKLEKGKYVVRDFSYDAGVYEMYQLSKGKGHLTTEDGKFNIDKATWMQWINIFKDLREKGVVTPAEVAVSEQEYDPKRDLLLNGTILFKQGFAAQFPSFDSVIPGNFALITAPRDKEAGGYLKPSMFWSVSEHSSQKEEAKKFIDFFINDPEATAILGNTRGLPVSSIVLKELSSSFTDSDKAQLNMINETAPDAQPFNGGPKGWGNYMQNDYTQVGEELIFEKISPEDAYEEIKAKFAETINN